MTTEQSGPMHRSQPDAETDNGDPILAIVRSHGQRAPYDAVDWAGMQQRIVASASPELERLRASERAAARGPGLNGRRLASRSWWEVTAAWARPAIAAAAAIIAVTTALVVGMPASTLGVDRADAPIARASSQGVTADRVEAELLGSSSGIDDVTGPISRDSLYAALVDAR